MVLKHRDYTLRIKKETVNTKMADNLIDHKAEMQSKHYLLKGTGHYYSK